MSLPNWSLDQPKLTAEIILVFSITGCDLSLESRPNVLWVQVTPYDLIYSV